MKGIKSFRRTFLLIAALYLACGISLLVWPAQSGLVICYVFGGISLLYGAVQIIRYCCNAAVSIFRYELVTGILCCAFGLFVILRADMVLAVLPFVFGCAIVFDSVMTLQNAIDLRRLGFSRWWLILLLAGKFALNPRLLLEELRHPVLGSILPTTSMALMLQSKSLSILDARAAQWLWLFAVALHLCLLLAFVAFRARQFSLHHMLPSWFVPFVGISVAAMTVPGPAYYQLAYGLMVFGMVNYAALLPVMLYRLIFSR